MAGRCISLNQGGPANYGSHLTVPDAMSSGEAGYISTAVFGMRPSHLIMLLYGLRYTGSDVYDQDNVHLMIQCIYTHKNRLNI